MREVALGPRVRGLLVEKKKKNTAENMRLKEDNNEWVREECVFRPPPQNIWLGLTSARDM